MNKDDDDELRQDPHVTSGAPDNALEVAIGRQVRSFRREHGLTITELARGARLSTGMLSKIENGQTSPSLSTLRSVASALNVPVTALFREFEEERDVVLSRPVRACRSSAGAPARDTSTSFWGIAAAAPSWSSPI